MKKNILSILTYNYYIQKFFNFIYIYKIRNLFRKIKNFFFKNSYLDLPTDNNLKKKYIGWSVIIFTTEINRNVIKKILIYKNFLKKNYELIIISNFNQKFFSHREIKIVNLNSNTITLGRKRNIGVQISRYDKIIMSMDYFKIKNLKIKKIEKEIKSKDLLVPKILTLDSKRYLDWMFLDYPKIGKCFCPYDIKDRRYMFFHGSYYILKRSFITNNKFSNYLNHKQGEDIDWSIRVRKKIKFALSDHLTLFIERFSYESEVLNDKNFIKNNILIKKNAYQ